MDKLVNALGDAYVGGTLDIIKGFKSPGIDVIGEFVYGPTNSPVFTKTNGTSVNNNHLAPDKTLTAGTYTFTSGGGAGTYDMYQTIYNINNGISYTVNMWVKLGTATNFCLVVNNTLGWNTIGGKVFNSADGLNTSTFTKVSYTFTGASTNVINLHLGAHLQTMTQQTSGTVYIWNIDITTNNKLILKNIDQLYYKNIDLMKQTTLNSGLICAPKANIPEHPDNVAGTTYAKDVFTAADIGAGQWLGGASSGLTISDGHLRVTATGSDAQCIYSVSASDRTYRVRVRPLVSSSTVRLHALIGGVYTLLKTASASAGQWIVIDAVASGSDTAFFVTITGIGAGNYFDLDWAYIGNGNYDSLALDASGNGNHGTVYGCTPVAGITGRALDGDGVNDYVLATYPNGTQYALSLWYKGTSTVNDANSALMVATRAADGATRLKLMVINGKGRFAWLDSGSTTRTVSTTANINDNSWHHLVGIHDGTTGSLFVDGVLIGSSTFNLLSTYNNEVRLFLGAGVFTGGTIDDPRIYNRALSAEEIWELYQNPGGAELNDMVMSVTGVPNSLVVRNASGNMEHSHTIAWTAGTTFGPTLSVQSGTAVAIPSASGTSSGAVTTTTQTFAGVKTFNANILTETTDGKVSITPTGWRTSQRASLLLLTKTNNPAEIDLVNTNSALNYGWQISSREGTTPDLVFYSNINTTYSERLKITASGNVGIGTTTVPEKLTVRGNIRIDDSSGNAGYNIVYDNNTKTLNFNFVGT